MPRTLSIRQPVCPEWNMPLSTCQGYIPVFYEQKPLAPQVPSILGLGYTMAACTGVCACWWGGGGLA